MRLLIAITTLLLSTGYSMAFPAEVEGWLVRDFAIKEPKLIACLAGRDFDGERA